jgi:hypothetical protein
MKKRAGSFLIGKRYTAGAGAIAKRYIATRAATRADAVVGEKTVRDNREVWRISSGGKIKSIATSASSTAAMDEAMLIYGHALKRLANR